MTQKLSYQSRTIATEVNSRNADLLIPIAQRRYTNQQEEKMRLWALDYVFSEIGKGTGLSQSRRQNVYPMLQIQLIKQYMKTVQ